jgi:hypothetical protein
MSEDNQSGFKISDRRLFKPDGTLRDDVIIEEEPAAPPALDDISSQSLAASSPAARVAPDMPESVAPPTYEAYAPEEPLEAEDPEGMPEQTLFTDFLMQMASSAFIYLGLVEHPATGRRQVNLEAAKDSIDLLDMLREKTRGNLTRGEDKLFEDLMADLKMQFVARRR